MISWALIEEKYSEIEEESEEYSFCSIEDALKKRGKHHYFCPECFQEVIPKRGLYLQSHFSHKIGELSCCRMRSKQRESKRHRQIQYKIYDMLGGLGSAEIEYFFRDIGRVADVVHFSSRTVYEIQVSSIHPDLAVQRTLSYWKIGWKVIWIFHEGHFFTQNRREVQNAFIFCGIPYYYSQKELISRNKIFWFFDALCNHTPFYKKELVNIIVSHDEQALSFPTSRLIEWLSYTSAQKKNLMYIPETLDMRKKLWKYHIKDDLLTSLPNEGEEKASYKSLFSRFKRKKSLWKALNEYWVAFLTRL